MANSPIYNWPEPDNTDLVKNGALAMRTLGDAIDTTMATMTPKSIVDAKGDLIAASAADTPARLAVGNNGETLVADSSTSTGLRYQAPVATNPIINGGMDIWQRGTSVAFGVVGGYGADRWIVQRGGWAGGATMSRQTGTSGLTYAARVQRDSGNTNTAGINIQTSVETLNSVPLQGQTVVLSFYARAGANFSSSGSALGANLYTGTGTDQNIATSGYTGQVTAISQNATLTTSWQRFSYTATLASNTNEIGLMFNYSPVGTAGANDWFEITGIQVEVGSVATPFRRSGGTIQGELAACRRYLPAINIAPTGSATFIGYAYTTNSAIFPIAFDVPARVGPTGITTPTVNTSNFTVRNKTNGDATIISLTFDISGVNGATLLAGATLTSGDVCRLVVNNTSYILFTGCEL